MAVTRTSPAGPRALAKGAGTSNEFGSRVQSVFSEAAKADGQIILFVDQLHQYAGERATTVASAAVQVAIEANHVRMIGGTSPEAYAEYIASDESLAKLFETISIDRPGENAITADTAENKDAKRLGERSKGDKISPDLRELINGAASGRDRISVILQTDDLGNADLRKLLSRNGVLISDSMAQIGMMTVEMPARSIALVAANRKVSYLSSNREIRTLGHLETTTGAADVRSQVNASGTSYTLDGTGISIAVLDSGMDTGHKSLTGLSNNGNSRVIYSQDFTGENRIDDPYGHGTHVTAMAAGNNSIASGAYTGIAPNANLVNLRVLNSQGVGSTSALLGALNWLLTNSATYNIRVVNMSLGAPAISSYKNDPLCQSVRKLVDTGIVVVAAAGNNSKDSNGNKIYSQAHPPGN